MLVTSKTRAELHALRAELSNEHPYVVENGAASYWPSGYFGWDGGHDSCITLRTCLIKDGKAYVQAGAGVVADSDPTYEYEETVNKSMAIIRAIGLAKTLSLAKPPI